MTTLKGPRAFGTILQSADLPRIDSDQNEGSFGIYGLGVFVRGFFSNLLRFSRLDEFHIFTTGFPGEHHPEFGLASDPRVRLRPLTDFPLAIREDNFAILHNPWGPDIGPWVDLRNRLASRNIPVTGLTHTISFQSMLPRLLLTLLLDAKPWDSVVCTAESAVAAMRNWLSHLRSHLSLRMNLDFHNRFDKVPLAVDVDSFRSVGDVAEHRRRFNLPENYVIALYFGRFSSYDKMDLAPLLLAFRKASGERSERAMLVMAGADSRFQYAAQVESIASALGISDSVRILRDIPAQDVARLYQAADIFVSPSDNLQETFGLTVVEAMASGLPVVCSEWDGYRDLVVDGETGFLIPTYYRPCDSSVGDLATMWEPEPAHFYLGQMVAVDVDRMAAALGRLIASAELRKEMGAAARLRARDHFDWPVVIREYEDLWTELGRVAQSQPFSSAPDSWFRPDYFKVFEGYGSSLLGPTTRVCATPRPSSIGLYHELKAWIQPDVVKIIHESAGEPIAVEALAEAVQARTGISEDRFYIHILRMLKYGELMKI